MCKRLTRSFTDIELKPILLYSESFDQRHTANKPRLKVRFDKLKKIEKLNKTELLDKQIKEKEKQEEEERKKYEEANRTKIEQELALKESLREAESKLKIFDYIFSLYTK